MSEGLNYAETTIQFDYPRKEAEFYTTKRSVFESLKRRNPNYTRAIELEPGYIITYPMEQVRPPRLCLKVARAGEAPPAEPEEPIEAADLLPFEDDSDG